MGALAGWCHPTAAGWAAQMVLGRNWSISATERPQFGIPQPVSAQGHQTLARTDGLSKPREWPVMGQQAGNSLYQTQMRIWRLNQRLPATGEDTRLSEAPNSVQIRKKIARMALSCSPCRRSGQQSIPRVPRSAGKGQSKRANKKLLSWELKAQRKQQTG